MSGNPNNPEDDAVASSSDTRGLLPARQRSSIEVGSDDEEGEGGAAGGVHPFQATPGYRVRRSTADADGGSRNNGDLVFRMEDWKFERLTTVPWAVLLMCVNFLVIFTGLHHDMSLRN